MQCSAPTCVWCELLGTLGCSMQGPGGGHWPQRVTVDCCVGSSKDGVSDEWCCRWVLVGVTWTQAPQTVEGWRVTETSTMTKPAAGTAQLLQHLWTRAHWWRWQLRHAGCAEMMALSVHQPQKRLYTVSSRSISMVPAGAVTCGSSTTVRICQPWYWKHSRMCLCSLEVCPPALGDEAPVLAPCSTASCLVQIGAPGRGLIEPSRWWLHWKQAASAGGVMGWCQPGQ